jgi:hypothetical protein
MCEHDAEEGDVDGLAAGPSPLVLFLPNLTRFVLDTSPDQSNACCNEQTILCFSIEL